jgi:UDP-N-acetyl-D-galactosamine dehydrogenase|tara:strand:+ start:29 stop:1276 length:1248 start_codon:yes stop_codon:yes gene_type:complete
MIQNKEKYKICILGLGYVGLPLATRFSLKGYNVVGYDINERRIEELTNQFDKNDDVTKDSLTILNNKAKLTSNILDINDSNIFIVTVPTPINKDKTPDLNPLINSTKLIGKIMTKGSIVIYESTVYPGVTDEVCTPILEEESKLTFNKDFSTGYSPERIVPGDKVNTIEKIKKIVSGSNAEALKVISALYSSIIDAGIHEAQSIKVAEAAKVTENIQRDVNIALINELHQLYSSLNIDTNHVIEAASTKWNFMKLSPGLVGGHCISIDPYYLMHKSEISGYIPAVMSAARNVNDQMDKWVLSNFLKFATKKNIDLSSVTVTILGYTFKENCSDTRNTKVYDLARSLKSLDVNIDIWDPFIDVDTQMKLKEIGIEAYTEQPRNIQLGFVCVYHDQILEFLNSFDGIIYDYKRPISV